MLKANTSKFNFKIVQLFMIFFSILKVDFWQVGYRSFYAAISTKTLKMTSFAHRNDMQLVKASELLLRERNNV